MADAAAIERAFEQSESRGWGFGNWALSKSALRALIDNMLARSDSASRGWYVLELGGGQSTLFFAHVFAEGIAVGHVQTIEHNAQWAQELQDRLDRNPTVSIAYRPIKQISDYEWKRFFSDPREAIDNWEKAGIPVPENEYNNFQIHNAFYMFSKQDLDALSPIDVLIVDGPHGNGRSLAYVLLYGLIKPGTLILVDDFTHYPFLEHLGRMYAYTELAREVSDKHWALVSVDAKRLG